MAEDRNKYPVDDLDAFFAAADGDNVEAVAEAAHNLDAIHGSGMRQRKPSTGSLPGNAGENRHTDNGKGGAGDARFIAAKPRMLQSGGHGEPFVRIPTGLPTRIAGKFPLWFWVAGIAGLALFAGAIMVIPELALNSQISHLGDANPANVSVAMRKLLVKADRRTVRKLYAVASSPRETITVRLRAIDVMGLVDGVADADNLLLRLELSAETNPQVSAAAAAARRQREAARREKRP